jgi:hypothetical protein
MRGFQLAATQLALNRDRAERRTQAAAGGRNVAPGPFGAGRRFAAWGNPEPAEAQWLLSLVSAYRMGYVGADPTAPRAFWDGRAYHLRLPDGAARAVAPPPEPVVPLPVLAPPPPVPYGYGYPPFRPYQR